MEPVSGADQHTGPHAEEQEDGGTVRGATGALRVHPHRRGRRDVGTQVLRGAAAHLEQDLQGPVDDAHPPSEEDKEGHQQLQEVVAEGLEAVEPPWGAVQEVGHGVGHRLCLWAGGGPEVRPGDLPAAPCPVLPLAAQEAEGALGPPWPERQPSSSSHGVWHS